MSPHYPEVINIYVIPKPPSPASSLSWLSHHHHHHHHHHDLHQQYHRHLHHHHHDHHPQLLLGGGTNYWELSLSEPYGTSLTCRVLFNLPKSHYWDLGSGLWYYMSFQVLRPKTFELLWFLCFSITPLPIHQQILLVPSGLSTSTAWSLHLHCHLPGLSHHHLSHLDYCNGLLTGLLAPAPEPL